MTDTSKDPEMVLLALSMDMDETKGNMMRRALHAMGAKRRDLEADNAAVVRAATAMHDEVAEGSMAFATREALRHALLRIIEQPHPGAALLEAHAKDVNGLKADNAALLNLAAWLYGRVKETAPDAGLMDAVHLLSLAHPGDALLAEHATEIARLTLGRDMALAAHDSAQRARLDDQAEYRTALESQQAEAHTLRRAFLHERHRADAAGAPPEHAYNMRWAENLLADERKALAEARNDGLERAAVACLTQRDRLHAANMTFRPGTRLAGLEEAASIARNLKEKT